MNDQRRTIDEADIPDLLANLVERSIITFDPSTNRYSMTETLRAFATEELGDDAHKIKHRHLDWLSNVADRVNVAEDERDDHLARKLISDEADNFRASLSWAVSKDPTGALHVAATIANAWMRWHTSEAAELLSRAIAASPDGEPADLFRARLLFCICSLMIGRSTGMHEYADNTLSMVQDFALNDPATETNLFNCKGWLYFLEGDLDAAEKFYRRSLDLSEIHGLPLWSSLNNLGDLERSRRRYELAQTFYVRALESEDRPRFPRVLVLVNAARNCIYLHDFENAEKFCRRAINDARFLGGEESAGDAFGCLGFVAVQRGLYRMGGLLVGYGEMLREQQRLTRDLVDQELEDSIFAVAYEHAGENFDAFRLEGRNLSFDDVLALLGEDA